MYLNRINSKRMIFRLGLSVFLLSATSSAEAIPHSCRCTMLPAEGLQVNCSFSKLSSLPLLPEDTTELLLQNNSLSTVSPGLLDELAGLKKLSLTGNPFHCDCRIQYLRNWLLKNRDIVTKEPTCASPSFVAKKAISDLSDDFFSSCSVSSCASGAYIIIIIGVVLFCVIALLLYSLRLAKKSTITLYIDERHALFEAHSLHSRKPKHKRKWSFLSKTEPLERPLLNMELLPQVLDVLHKKHNIKIKET